MNTGRSRANPASLKTWSVYLVRTAGGAIYTGIAIDVDRRLSSHADGRGAKFLRGRAPLELVYKRKVGTRSLALIVEHRLKRLRRIEKEQLVEASPSRRRLLSMLRCTPRRS